jgi:menaquinone reductase, molybdopterin-binding-like subunit
MSRFSRRELLGGAALAGAVALGCGRKKDPYRIDKPPVPRVPGWRAGEERWVLSTCALCDAGCGIKVRVVEGRAVKIEGNPEHPVNRGGLCSRGQAALQLLYHPDRVRSPLRRTGARGEGKWKPISWDEAIAEVAAKLARLRAAGHPERLVLIDGETGTLTHDLWARFLSAFGSPNHLGLESTRAASAELASLHVLGRYGQPVYDLDRAALVLAMGTELLESSSQAMRFMRSARASAEDGHGRRQRVICVSPRRPHCRVDDWIPIAPGGHGALALSLAHVLLHDGLVDRQWLRAHVFGFAAWRDQAGVEQPGFEALLQAAYAPDETKDATGIPAATVERLAHTLAEQQPALVAGDGGAVAAGNGLSTSIAICALNTLLGDVGVRLRWPGMLADWEDLKVDTLAATVSAVPRIDGVGTAACPFGCSRVQAIPAAIIRARPYPVEALFLRGADPVATLPARRAWTVALRRVPLLVSFSAWLDETAWLADLVLPESLFLEAWDMVRPEPSTDRPVLSFRQPVVTALHDTRQSGDFVLALAAGLGGSIGSSLHWKSYQEVVEKSLPPASMDVLKEKGVGRRVCADDESCKQGLGEISGDAFLSPSALFQIFSNAALRLAGTGNAVGLWPGDGLPLWQPPRFSGDPLQFPLHLVPYRPVQFVENGMGFLPWLNELPLVTGDPWPVRAEINLADAARFGLADGDRVLVESQIGSCEAVAQLSDGVQSGVMAMALGKSGVIDLVVPDEDHWSGVLAWQGTRVRVRKLS